jgi:cyclic pyranopterin phosphate synthase
MTTGSDAGSTPDKRDSINGSPLVDPYSRRIDYLRISLTQECNHVCFFCHREGETCAGTEMTPEEIERLVQVANERGIRRIKLTGGEALLREDIVEIVRRLDPLTDDLSLTTNGSRLHELALPLRDAGLDRVNVSLHTLNHALHEYITGVQDLEEIKRGIETAIEVGLTPVKLNMPILAGFNDNEIPEIMEYAGRIGAILQLIELQNLPDEDRWKRYWFDLTPIEEDLERRAVKVTQRSLHGRKQYTIPLDETTVQVEVVKPQHNQSFCQRCTRLRVTSDGKLKPCFLKQDNLVEVRSLLSGESNSDMINDALEQATRLREPYWKGDSG